MKFKLLLIGLVVFSGTSLAEPWSGSTSITMLYPHTGGMIFNTTYINTQLSSCDGGTRFSIDKSHPNYETLVSTLLAAFMSGKKINFNINNGQTLNCSPTINRFQLFQ